MSMKIWVFDMLWMEKHISYEYVALNEYAWDMNMLCHICTMNWIIWENVYDDACETIDYEKWYEMSWCWINGTWILCMSHMA